MPMKMVPAPHTRFCIAKARENTSRPQPMSTPMTGINRPNVARTPRASRTTKAATARVRRYGVGVLSVIWRATKVGRDGKEKMPRDGEEKDANSNPLPCRWGVRAGATMQEKPGEANDIDGGKNDRGGQSQKARMQAGGPDRGD